MSKNLEPIAVIGVGAIMPLGLNKEEIWQNILQGKNCITEVPKDRWDSALFYSPDRSVPDRTYSKIGGFIQGFKFNSLKYRIPPNVALQMDDVQKLALEITHMALEDSGYDKKDFDRTRTAVIIANAMGGGKNEMSCTRVYKALYYDMLRHSKSFSGLPPQTAQAVIDEVEAQVNQKFSPITEDTMPGELSNVISGRVANVFNFNGPTFAIDAACASSIFAIEQAVNGLRQGCYDTVFCGGIDQMMSPAAYIKFSKIGAISGEGSFAFDARANGFVMAEGAGIVMLKRLSDAVKAGDKIYGLIRAIGTSSDGKGKGITAPNPKGQKLAIERAFDLVDYTPADVGLMEAHGTATSVGDAAELNALNEIFAPYADAGSVALGSIKSQMGHAKAAAGIASVIKVMLALYHKILPPSINFVTPNPAVDWDKSPFKVNTKTRSWETENIRRANVSSFGFGGTNTHLAAEEYIAGRDYSGLMAQGRAPSNANLISEEKQMTQNTNFPTEDLLVPLEKLQGDMLVFSADGKEELFETLSQAARAVKEDVKYLTEIAYKNHTAPQKNFAVAFNVETPQKFKEKADFFIKTAAGANVWEEESIYLKMKGIYPFRPLEQKHKICFMFPGQGSQYVDMMKDLAAKYQIVRDTFAEADEVMQELMGHSLTGIIWSTPQDTKAQLKEREEQIKQTQITQPAILAANTAMMRLLFELGIRPDVVMGHSLGEYGAAVASGILSFKDAIKAVAVRGTAMADIKVEDTGKMAAVSASLERVEPELKKISGYIAVANKNCPTQTVIAGASKSVDDAVAMFNAMGVQAVLVPVSHGFHSAIVEPAMPAYREFLNTLTIYPPKLPITSNVSADFYPADTEQIKDLLTKQIMSSVEWVKQINVAYARGIRLFIECGPKRVLSAFVTSTLADRKDARVLSSNHPKRGGISEFNDLLANLTAANVAISWDKLDMKKEDNLYSEPFKQAFGCGAKAQAKPALAAAQSAAAVCAAPAAFVAPATPVTSVAASSGAAPNASCAQKEIVISGIAAGTPGSWSKVFADGNIDDILRGHNFIENVPVEAQQKQIDKNVEYIVKSRVGNHRVEKLNDISQAVKLVGKRGAFDLEKEFGLPQKWVKSMDSSFTLAIAAGLLALKDAGIPLVLYYKPTTAGSYLPDRWGLPSEMIDDTGVIFTSAFPTANTWAYEVATKVADALINKTKEEINAFYRFLTSTVSDEQLRTQLTAWLDEHMASYQVHRARVFSQDFLLKAIPIAHSQFCQWIRARGPATHISGACASTAQAVSLAEDWIKLERAKRVIIISADDITNNFLQEWVLAAFLASGVVSREAEIANAALPFDRRRNGMIVSMGAVGLVVEDAQSVKERGMVPLTKLLVSELTNSAFHPTRLDVNHVAEVMDRLLTKAERKYGLSRAQMAKETVFISHETYTPARGGSASAEVYGLKHAFKESVKDVIVSNVKGFTGHAMGAGLEDVVAVRSLNTGLVPPIANYREPDPELQGINLSKGGKYNFKYALRLAAGFGSQLSMTLQEKVWEEGSPRIADNAKYAAWLKRISNQQEPMLEVVNNTLRIKDNYKTGKGPALVMESAQAFADKAELVEEIIEERNAPAAAKVQHSAQASAPASVAVSAPAFAASPAPAPIAAAAHTAPAAAPKVSAAKLDEAAVTDEILDLMVEKTGYPKDMLELDLDMEADLGIDTVKQAELFASLQGKFNLPQSEGVQLKDYPTIRHCVKYVLSASEGGTNTVSAPAPAPIAQTPVIKPAPAPITAAAHTAPAAAKLDEASVTDEILDLMVEKTGYPKDMLELDLDMEADLGIDTVKQAELFASLQGKYNLPQNEGVQLKDYPTIRHCVKYVLSASEGGADKVCVPAPAPIAQTPAAESEPVAVSAPAFAASPAPAPIAAAAHTAPAAAPKVSAAKLDEAAVTDEILDLMVEKTGYPKDMLELDLDMEADLGIDTVKQAELFASLQGKYNLPQNEGVQLKDYPTIRHCINYVMSASSGAQKQAEQTAEEKAPVAVEEQPAQPAQLAQPEQEKQTEQPAAHPVEQPAEPAKKEDSSPKEYEGQDAPDKKYRFVPHLVSAPLEQEASRKLSAARTVLIMADNALLTKAYTDIFKQQGIKTHIFTALKMRGKNVTLVNWDNLEEFTKVFEAYAKENEGSVQGIVYLLPCSVKKYDKKANPHGELTKYLMPLFIACKVFLKDLSERKDADTFIASVFKIDGAFSYKTKEIINPSLGSVCGAANCFRKDMYQLGGVLSKILDFEPSADADYMAQKTLDEILKGDERAMVGFYKGERSTIFALPRKLDMSVKHMDLKGKTIAFTGAGRGIGALLSQKIAAQYGSRILILDIIELSDKSAYWATLNEQELAELKAKIWQELKADASVRATPVLLEKAFGRVKDSITLYKNMQKIKALGGQADYYHCDVTNGTMMKEVITKIKAKYGKIDGLIHFAGIEHSKLLTDKTVEEYYRVFDVKATSAAVFVANNLVKESGFYAFASSIAGKYGNLGQADYASANDYISKLCISLHNQGQRSVSIDMSAYANIGMGVRPGVMEFLSQQGLEFVNPHDGMQIFLNEIVYGKIPEIILSGSLGTLDWDKQVRVDDAFEIDPNEGKDEEGFNPVGDKFTPEGDKDDDSNDEGRDNGGGQEGSPEGSAAQPEPELEEEPAPKAKAAAKARRAASPAAVADKEEELSLEEDKEEDKEEIKEELKKEAAPEKEAKEKISKEGSAAPKEQENFFLGDIQTLEKGKNIFAQVTFSAEYPFLKDHSIGGTPYVPGVMGIETFMEAAAALDGQAPSGLEDVHFHLPIKLLRSSPVVARIKGERGPNLEQFEIESDFINSKGVKMGNTRRHFTARPLPNKDIDSKWNNYKGQIDVGGAYQADKEVVYSRYFHGPSFQVLDGILRVDDKMVLGVYQKPAAVLFHDGPKHLIAHPLLIEAAFQTCGWRDLSVENRETLPDSIGKLYIQTKGVPASKLFTLCIYNGKNIEGKSIYDAFVFDESGKLWIELSDYQMIGR